ncbi:hypothetical protein [Tamilnaduibacter salinus]|uniref:hypothetical protein n=1 Tax=Tamilnaduibacter salinus TaxID=1484056 RepID=UPI00117FD05C|nr:hypothetical protein [Tamilnaduibacter salinus]
MATVWWFQIESAQRGDQTFQGLPKAAPYEAVGGVATLGKGYPNAARTIPGPPSLRPVEP